MSEPETRVVYVNTRTAESVELVAREGKLLLEGTNEEVAEARKKLLAMAYSSREGSGVSMPPTVQRLVVGKQPGPPSLVTRMDFSLVKYEALRVRVEVTIVLERLAPPPRPVAP